MARIAMTMRPSGFGSLMTVIRTKVPPFPSRLTAPQDISRVRDQTAEYGRIYVQRHRQQHDYRTDGNEPVPCRLMPREFSQP